MSVTMKVEVGEVGERFGGSGRRHLAHAHQSSEALGDLDVHQVRCVKLFLALEQSCFHPGT